MKLHLGLAQDVAHYPSTLDGMRLSSKPDGKQLYPEKKQLYFEKSGDSFALIAEDQWERVLTLDDKSEPRLDLDENFENLVRPARYSSADSEDYALLNGEKSKIDDSNYV